MPYIRLGDVIELKRGYDLPARQRQSGSVPIISSSGPSGRHDEAKVTGPGVVTGRYGTIGQVFFVEGDFWPLNTSLYVKDFKGHNPRFIFYFLQGIDWERFNDKSGVPGINRNHAHEAFVTIPPAGDHEAIAELLGALDDKSDLNRRMNETLEAMARAIFKDWFVDFGPTRAKADGRAPYLAPELWDLFPDALDQEGKPVGWTLASLSVLAEANPESWSKKNAPKEIVYVDLSNTKWGSIDATHHFLWRDAPSRAKRILRPGDTILGLVRPGNGSYAFIGTSGLTGSTGFAVLRPREPRYAELVFLSATAPENIERLANLADGAAYPAVRPEVVEATEVVVADNAVTASFSALVAPIIDRMERNKIESQTLARTRDLLLPRLMSGEIRLSQAEKLQEGAA
ncbi:MAG: restriction endonuclease subunit S [Boseongicola sp. SB0670_bin_30]|nr:restriction endonuclease subunit S [Boseongicola sp. SB0670_bin_30]